MKGGGGRDRSWCDAWPGDKATLTLSPFCAWYRAHELTSSTWTSPFRVLANAGGMTVGGGQGERGVGVGKGGRGIVAMALHGVSNMQIACGSLRFFAFNECPAYSTHELDVCEWVWVCESLCVCVCVLRVCVRMIVCVFSVFLCAHCNNKKSI